MRRVDSEPGILKSFRGALKKTPGVGSEESLATEPASPGSPHPGDDSQAATAHGDDDGPAGAPKKRAGKKKGLKHLEVPGDLAAEDGARGQADRESPPPAPPPTVPVTPLSVAGLVTSSFSVASEGMWSDAASGDS